MTSRELQFAAFLSYSRKDVRLASWLARSLEAFRLPRQTVEELKARRAPFLASRPIFRDQQDMPVGGVISERLCEELDASATAIVLCTASSVKSDWVNREIELFASRHPDRRIIPVVAEGDPDRDETYPHALLKLGMPLAADLRDPRERRQAVVKIAAAVLDLDVDQLVGRVQKHRAKQLRWLVAGTGTAAIVLAGLVVTAGVMARSAQLANDRAFGQVDQLLTTTRANMDDLSAKKALHEAARLYFDSKAGKRLGDRDLLLKAEWLRQEGQDAALRHEDAQSLAFRKEAHGASSELLRRKPANPEFLFSHSQSAYWMGDYYFRLGDFEAARPYLQEYADVADRLLRVAPDYVNAALKTDAHSEVFYAQVNLGQLALEQNHDPRAAAQAFFNALESLDPHPESLSAQLDLSRAHMQYIDVLAQFAPAAEVMEAVRAWEPLLLTLEAHSGNSDVDFHVANSWVMILRFRDHLSASVQQMSSRSDSKKSSLFQSLTRDPDNATSLSLAAEFDQRDAGVRCQGIPPQASMDITSKSGMNLIAMCLDRLPTSEQLARCSAFADAIPRQPGLLDKEAGWATLLSACSRSAHRARDPGLSERIEQIGAEHFFTREPEQMRLRTQFALADFAARESNDWIPSLNTSLAHRGWTTRREN